MSRAPRPARASRPARRARLFGVAGIALLPLALAGAAAAPQVTVDADSATVGERTLVRLAGWPAGNVLVEVCGNEAARGSADCAVASAAQTYVPDSGDSVVRLTVTAPPVACPCVIRARATAGGPVATTPITLDGLPDDADEAAPTHTPTEAPVITEVRIEERHSWAALFGGPAPRTVTVMVANPGEETAIDPHLTVLVGRGDHPTTQIDAPQLGPIEPGGQRTYELPVTIPAPAFGHYTVRGELDVAVFLAETTHYPWGLPALFGALALLALLRAGLRPRRRGAHRSPRGRRPRSAG